MSQSLAFKVGQQAESKSFLTGFRGAWFRCKIKDISLKKGQIGYSLEFFDFPDEKISWTKLYQKPPTDRVNSQERKLQLMVRPGFPPIYNESQIPDTGTISEVVAIINNVWMVGDLVDWFSDGCYWSGRVTHLLGNDKVQIELLKPPVGEGGTYEAFYKDLRPLLDWSPEQGWTVPNSEESGTCRYCARLIEPVNEDKERIDNCATGGVASSEFIAPVSSHSSASLLPPPDESEHPPAKETVSSHSSASSLPPPDESKHPPAKEMLKEPSSGEVHKETETPHTDTDLDTGDSVLGKASFADSVSSSHETNASAAVARTTGRKDRYSYTVSSKKMRTSGDEYLNSMCSDTIESTVVDLEELANRIKWLKRVLELGFPLSNATRPPWKFLENRASLTQR